MLGGCHTREKGLQKLRRNWVNNIAKGLVFYPEPYDKEAIE